MRSQHEEDLVITTSGGLRIPVNSAVLCLASPVFEYMIERRRRNGKLSEPINIVGVPCGAVVAFVRLLCSRNTSSRTSLEHAEAMEQFAMHLMVLAHVYRVKWLKDMCKAELALRLGVDSVIDMLQLARQCDVPKLQHQCMKLLRKDFAAIEKTEAWIFLQNNDPWLELEILQFLDELEMRQKRRRRAMEEQKVYLQLSEAMECLQHICTEGCTSVGPFEAKDLPNKHKALISCPNYTICSSIQNLIRHLASCRTGNRSACPQCRRIWDLLHLHSSTCHLTHHCKVPLCKQFKLRMQMEGKGDGGKWKVLAKRVGCVKVMASLAKRRQHDMY